MHCYNTIKIQITVFTESALDEPYFFFVMNCSIQGIFKSMYFGIFYYRFLSPGKVFDQWRFHSRQYKCYLNVLNSSTNN